jgi:iron complex outermembrane receptor protein
MPVRLGYARAMRFSPLSGALLCALCLPSVANAQDATDATTLDRIEVNSTRLRGVPAFDQPASISSVDARAHDGSDITAYLGGVPGLAARARQNLAQDTQLSIRGFGARSTFGVRGLRLYADGIPATMPDGQGQVSHFALAGAERIEVMRGPFSALHGNSSGGVVQVWSAPGEAPTIGHVDMTVGRDDTQRLSASLRGARGAFGHALSASLFDTGGWRDHGAAKRQSFNANLHADLPGGGRLRLVANHFDAPDARDPLGLTRAQADADPRQAVAVAHQFDTRKSVRQQQLGLRLEQPLRDGHALEVMAYAGGRDVEQFLPVPVAAQANPLHSGGVIDLDNAYGGVDLRWQWRGTMAGRTLDLVAGANADRQRQHRRGFENFDGERPGVRGALRRDERNRTGNDDAYAQAWWWFAPRWSLLTGARHSRVRFRTADHYLTALNPDDSGRVAYSATTPMLGLVFAPARDWRLHLSAGRGFETPTFNELAYRADGGAGLALDLAAAHSRNLEFGARWRGRGGARVEAALFRADTDDELAAARAARAWSCPRRCRCTRTGGSKPPGPGSMLRSATRSPSVPRPDAPIPRCWCRPARAFPALRGSRRGCACHGSRATGTSRSRPRDCPPRR